MPETVEAIERYLSGGVIKGIGPATAKKIVNKFKESTIEILKNEPDEIAKIKGITKQKAQEISEEFNEKWELWQIVGFLEKFGISTQNCKKVYEIYGNNSIEEIEKNPYVLIDIVYGADFKKIDKIAIGLGVTIDNYKRIESGIKYALAIASNNGNTCVLRENLIEYVKELLEIQDEESIIECITNLIARGNIMQEDIDDKNWIFLDTFFMCEKNIAEKLLGLKQAKNIKKIKNFKEKLKIIEHFSEMELSNKQREAIELINENNVCIITGGPGTGKTTIIKFIIEIYKREGKKVALCAPTGRAAKRMSEATGHEAMTIHRLLQLGKTEETLKIEKLDCQIAPIDADIIIVDEVSMVDVFIMNYILKGTYLGTKLVLVGDSNQLPSVGPGNVLKDIINSDVITTVELNQIFRQAAKSKIITVAHEVNEGEKIKIVNDAEKLNDLFLINEISQEKMLSDVLSLASGRLQKYGNYDFFKNIQVISATKKGMLGTKELNRELQRVLNNTNSYEKINGDRVFKVGDRVMQIKNNYDISWEKSTGEIGTGVFNGEFGKIEKISENDKQIQIYFDDDKEATYGYSELEQIEHAYAITIHKSQRK